jgi:undecaprenyl-diphosphatase
MDGFMMQNINYQLFNFFNAGLNLHGWQLAFAVSVAKYLVYVVPIWLVVIWVFGSPKLRGTLLFAVVTTCCALLISYLIGKIWFQPRPFMIGLGHVYLKHAPDSTFPSDHVTFMSAVGISLLSQSRLRWAGIAILLLALCVGWARVFLGIHFPFDILGGFLLSTIVVIVLSPIRPWINQQLLPRVENIYRKIFSKLIANKIVQG